MFMILLSTAEPTFSVASICVGDDQFVREKGEIEWGPLTAWKMNFMDAGQLSEAFLQIQQFLFVYLCVSLLELRSYSEYHSI